MSGVAFVDTETTGLDPKRHEVWEVALIVEGPYNEWGEHVWQLPVDLGRAELMALKIGRFHERHDIDQVFHPQDFVRDFRALTWGKHLVGAVPSFDEERLRKLLRKWGECPGWHYHLIDVEALAVGYLHGRWPENNSGPHGIGLPWNSEDLSRAAGVDPEQFDRHTALGDARWAKAIYETVVGL